MTRPLQRVGIYVPGTAAPLPSTALMCAIPARIAGVEEVYIASPTLEDGSISPIKLVAAEIAGVDAVFKAGGAQAIAALAYGTESIPKVDKIYGPGGLFVTIAKQAVYGDVGVDAIYGPTETVIVADESGDPDLIAADLLAQAEHDRLASPILLTPSRSLAEKVRAAVKIQLLDLERAKIAEEAFENRGGCILVSDIEQAIELANEYAPEHLCLVVENPTAWVTKVKNAGGVFLGETSPEAVGDYTAGPSHTMPTGGSAKWSSPLGVSDFLKTISVVNIPPAEAEELARMASIIARAEGLTAHAASVERRIQGR
jgi:histidinol dehydrogenase